MTSYESGGDEDIRREFLFTQDARERPPGLLTYDDREYLLGKKDDLGETGEVQLRQRMRDRIRSGLLDFELLLYLLDNRDLQTIFDNVTEPPWPTDDEISSVYKGTRFVLAFLYLGITEHTRVNFERLLEDAIERSGERSRKATSGPHYRHAEADVNIEVNWSVVDVSVDHALEQLRNGERLTDKEIGALVRSGELEDQDWARLREMERD